MLTTYFKIFVIWQQVYLAGINCQTSYKEILDVFIQLPDAIQRINYSAFVVTIATIAIIYLIPKITKAIPSTLIALLAMTIFSSLCTFEIPIIGEMPSGLPELKVESILTSFN